MLDPYTLTVAAGELGDIHLLPVLHERVDLAAVTRLVLARLDPAAVAVELPTTLRDAVERAVARLPQVSVVISEEPGEEALIWVAAPGDPIVEAVRWATERGRPWSLVDPDVADHRRQRQAFPDPHVAWSLGPAAYLTTVLHLAGAAPPSAADDQRERGMAHHLRQARAAAGGPLLAVLGASHVARVADYLDRPTAEPFARRQRTRVDLRHPHPDSFTTLLPDLPLAHAVYETLRSGEPPDAPELATTVTARVELVIEGLRLITGAPPDDPRERAEAVVRYTACHAAGRDPDGRPRVDRSGLGRVLWRLAEAAYREHARGRVESWQRTQFFDFARRYARVQGLWVPGLYEWVVAARGVGDDNLAWEVFDLARCYPWQGETAEIDGVKIDGDALDLGTRTVRFRRRFLRVKQRLVAVPVRRRPATADPAEWLAGFTGDSICSYPPEDLVVEDYGRFLQHKAVSILAAESERTEPFSSSLLDGVDLRATVRNWHTGTIYVRQLGKAPRAAGAVVVIFDDPPDPAAYPYLVTWLGEHDQESDMAFYATAPSEQIVGPGIMRATYGGFMLTGPPGRLAEVWEDPDYGRARSPAEVLVMAAVDYSEDQLVVHVAARPPASWLADYAARQAKRLVHVPIGSLSPHALAKLRVVHILSGRDKRAIARDYVW